MTEVVLVTPLCIAVSQLNGRIVAVNVSGAQPDTQDTVIATYVLNPSARPKALALDTATNTLYYADAVSGQGVYAMQSRHTS